MKGMHIVSKPMIDFFVVSQNSPQFLKYPAMLYLNNEERSDSTQINTLEASVAIHENSSTK